LDDIALNNAGGFIRKVKPYMSGKKFLKAIATVELLSETRFKVNDLL
jgi:hypothetical protein